MALVVNFESKYSNSFNFVLFQNDFGYCRSIELPSDFQSALQLYPFTYWFIDLGFCEHRSNGQNCHHNTLTTLVIKHDLTFQLSGLSLIILNIFYLILLSSYPEQPSKFVFQILYISLNREKSVTFLKYNFCFLIINMEK